MQEEVYGPQTEIGDYIHALKYRGHNESFKEAMSRVANSLKDSDEHYHQFRNILLDMRFLPAGRVQAAMGAPRETTPYNCYVSGTIGDSMDDIMEKAKEGALTMKKGGGIGYDFSTLRPRNDLITTLESHSSGPVSFMNIYDAVCSTVASAGHRRGAQMGVMRVDHPDIEEFVSAKTNSHVLTNFNISVGVTDEFMDCVRNNTPFNLRFGGRTYRTISAVNLWDKILRNTWDWAEPGILFIDRINRKNNLWYCETIAATNPCGEQPLPPYGACLLGSFNLTKYIKKDDYGNYWFDYDSFKHDIPIVVRAMDNVVDRAVYPLPQQEHEAKSKRRMGLGITGVANAIESLGHPYGSPKFIEVLECIMSVLRDGAYKASIQLAIEKGPFPLFDERMLESEFTLTLPNTIRNAIANCGIRNSHLLSVAPTGTISLSADNISSGIEPVYNYEYFREFNTPEGMKKMKVEDYGKRVFGMAGRRADDLNVLDHVRVLNVASAYVDSACSKTCNVGGDVSWEEFKNVYMRAYEGGASGCTTFRAAGKRYGILSSSAMEDIAVEDVVEDKDFIGEGTACYYDPSTGNRTCE